MAVQDPSISGVPGRYATALYELASDEKAVDEVGKNLASIGQMLDESEDLVRLVRSPVFGSDEQWDALSAVLTKAGIKGLTSKGRKAGDGFWELQRGALVVRTDVSKILAAEAFLHAEQALKVFPQVIKLPASSTRVAIC